VKAFFRGRIRSRTLNLLIRSQMLYPIELYNQFPEGSAKVRREILDLQA
jgi:hypothetical protein